MSREFAEESASRRRAADLAPRRFPASQPPAAPAAPLHLASVYACADPDEALRLTRGEQPGYFYSRCGHPNADELAAKFAALHGAPAAAVLGSGMSAFSAVALALLAPGDSVVVARQAYGTTLRLVVGELARWGVRAQVVDAVELTEVRRAASGAKLLIGEILSNPRLQMLDVAAWAEIAASAGATLVVDNTFATAGMCRPLEWGADLVVESLTKFAGGHGDSMLGAVCGPAESIAEVDRVATVWGFRGDPFSCWLIDRGLRTLDVRLERACQTAARVAEFLATRPEVAGVDYPGRPDHPQAALAARQFGDRRGWMVCLRLAGGGPAARRFISAVAESIPFCPSLGETAATLSHPASTSHAFLTEAQRAELGIDEGTIRLSIGIESSESVIAAIAAGLDAAGA